MDLVNSPNKLHIKDGEGTSKNRDKAKEVLSESIDEVLETLDNQITEKYVFTIFSLGGGTGSGCGPFLSSVIAENPEKKVGLVIILPSKEESLQARINAYEALSEILPLKNSFGASVQFRHGTPRLPAPFGNPWRTPGSHVISGTSQRRNTTHYDEPAGPTGRRKYCFMDWKPHGSPTPRQSPYGR